MVTLQKKQLKFNPKIQLSNDGGKLSSHGGLLLVNEFLHTINFKQMVTNLFSSATQTDYRRHSFSSLLTQCLFQTIEGYRADNATTVLKNDPVFTQALEKEKLASQSSLSRFWHKFDCGGVDKLDSLNRLLVKKIQDQCHITELIIDLDSTHSDTYGQQEQTNYNAHYQTNGYHPLVAFDGINGTCLKAELRSGNVYSSTGVRHFLEPLLSDYQHSLPNKEILIRGDSGFATPELYDLAEEAQAFYVIRLKSNNRLETTAESFVTYGDDTNWLETESQYFDYFYQANSWSKPRRVAIQSTRHGLLFSHAFVVTNLSQNVSPKTVFDLYKKRGTMENYIKEIKTGFHFDKTDSPSFVANSERMMVSVLAYNIINAMKLMTFPKECRSWQINTIRLNLLRIAAKVTTHARKIRVQLTSSNVYDSIFWLIFKNIRTLPS
ncbi:IS1380 family transposase [Listeria monocytogenes]|nr:IS1380 family transposase [Listeria monocytogenes]